MDINSNIIANMLTTETAKPKIQYVTSLTSVTTATNIRSPRLAITPGVGPNYLAILTETATAVTNDGDLTGIGWTLVGSMAVVNHRTRIYYKILEYFETGVRYEGQVGGTQYDQMLLFKTNSNQKIGNIRLVEPQTLTASGQISSTLSTASSDHSYLAIHYYFSSTASPTISYTPTMQRVANSDSNLTGISYSIYNGTTPGNLTQTANATLGTNPRQALFWLALS